MIHKINNGLSAAACVILLSMTSTAASAVGLSLQPASLSANPGDTISLNLWISGLGDGAADSLGDFDLDLSFDASALTFQTYTLGGFLGDLGAGDAADFSLGASSGTVNLSALSFLSTVALDNRQPSTFELAALHFTVLASPGVGTAVVIGNVWALGDGFGSPLALNAMEGAVIAVVPEAPMSVMMLLGLAGIGWALRRRPGSTALPEPVDRGAATR